MRAVVRFVLALLFVCLCPVHAPAQAPTAALTGVITAPDGARLPGATLRLVNVESSATVVSISSDAGVFRIPNLAPGRYRLDVELAGFEPSRVDDLVLDAVETTSITVRLVIASLHEQVRVVASLPRDTVEAFAIRESRATDVGEAMSATPGVTKLRKGAIASDVVVRGFQGKDVTVLIDGQRIDGACPGHMDPPAFHVDFAEVNRVELTKDPFDVKNQGGLGGVVNIVTERPQRGWHGTANLAVASAAALSSSALGSVGDSGWAALGGASARRADPYRDGSGARMTDASGYQARAIENTPAYDVWTAWGRLAIVPRGGTTAQLSYTRQSADAILYPYLQMDALFDTADRAGARLEIAELPGGWGAFAAHAYYTGVDHWMTDELRTSGAGKARAYSMGTRAKTAIAGGRAEIQHGDLTVGFEASRRNWKTSTMLAMQAYAPQAAVPDVDIDVAGAFVSYSAGVGARWRLEAGGRLDHATSTADPALAGTKLYYAYYGTDATSATDVLPAGYVRARWRQESGWSTSISAGRSTRLPDQQERFYALQRMGSDWVGNPGLAPSRNTGLDGELRYTRRGIDTAISAFVYRLDDYIRLVQVSRRTMVPGVMNGMARSYANIDALMRGVEASGTVPLGRSLFLSADASMVRGTARDGGDLPEMPPARGRIRLRYDAVRWNAVAEVAGAAAQNHVAVDLRESPTPAFAIVNLRGAMRWGPVQLSAALENVLDAFYAEHLSYQRDPFRNGVTVHEPGRTLMVSAAARF